MATLKTSLVMYDGVTGPMKSITKAMNIALNSFESMERASGRAVDVSAFQTAREELAKAQVACESLEQSLNDAGNAQKRLNQNTAQGSNKMRDLLEQAKGVAAALLSAQAVGKVVGLSDQMVNTQARLKLLVDDEGAFDELNKKVYASANRARALYTDTGAAIAKMAMNAGDAFENDLDQVITFTELINKQFVIGGASAQEQSAAMLQLTQAMASGVLRGEELNSIFEQAPGIVQNIADYLGVPIGQIRNMAAEGQITAEIVKNAMFQSADEINRKFGEMPMTWAQVWSGAKNISLQVFEPALMAINWLANHIGIIGPLVLGLGGAFTVFLIAANWTKIAAFATAAYNAVVGFLSIGFGVLTGNTAAASAAVFTFNSALLANPIPWVIMLIILLIAILYAGVAAYNKFTGSAVSATGIIAGAFAVLGAFLINSFIIPGQNAFAAFANFIGNVFHNPVAAVQMLFYDMCLTVIGYIRSLAQGIEDLLNSIPGIEVSITSGLDGIYSGLQDARQKVKDESGWVEYVKKMDFIDYSDAYSAGYDFGKGLESKVAGAFDLGKTDFTLPDSSAIQPYDAAKTGDAIAGNTGDIAQDTAKMANTMEMSNEELRYLREIAERQAIDQFTTAEINLVMNNNNQIGSDADLDGIINILEQRVEQTMLAAAEGVHT